QHLGAHRDEVLEVGRVHVLRANNARALTAQIKKQGLHARHVRQQLTNSDGVEDALQFAPAAECEVLFGRPLSSLVVGDAAAAVAPVESVDKATDLQARLRQHYFRIGPPGQTGRSVVFAAAKSQ